MKPDVTQFVKSASMLNDTTFEIVFQDDALIDLEAIELVDTYCDQVVAGRRLKRLVVSGKNTLITKEARLFGQ